MRHEDERRILYDWANGPFKSSKAVVFKENTPIGNHIHLKKDEEFFLLEGKFLDLVVGEEHLVDVEAPFYVVAKRGQFHRFVCEKGSILLSVATEPYSTDDDYITGDNL